MQFSTAFSIILNICIYINSCQAVYNPNSKSNVALYWGQGAGQQRLSYYCSQSTVDVIPIGFVDIFPAQGNGFPGTNFGNQCYGPPFVYPGPGSNPSLNQLQSECPNIVADIPICQSTYSKKIILSIGGATATNPVVGAAAGIAFADFLWGAFGPQTSAWLASGQPRPFDGPNGEAVEVDGFDFDIEWPSPDMQEGLIAMASRLRTLFQIASKPYLLTGAPQCITTPPNGDANMGLLIQAVPFDIIWVQFYSTPQCSARSWVTANPNYIDGQPEKASGFSYHEWTSFLATGASKAAKLYIGLLGAPDAGNFYLTPTEISSLIDAYYCDAQFGGIMIWEATSAENNPTGPYQAAVKSILTGYDSKPPLLCAGASSPSTTSAKSTTTTFTLSTQTSSTSSLQTISSVTTSPTSSSSASSPTTSTISSSRTSITSSSSSLTSTTTSKSSPSPSPSTTTTTESSLSLSSSITITTSSLTTKIPSSTTKTTTTTASSSKVSKSANASEKKTTKLTNSIQSTLSTLTTSTTSKATISNISIKTITTTGSPKCTTSIASTSTTSSKAPTTSSKSTSSTFTTKTMSKTSSTSVNASPTLLPVPDGGCGAAYGVSCQPGYCCSKWGYCGQASIYCSTGLGCQSAFGTCN